MAKQVKAFQVNAADFNQLDYEGQYGAVRQLDSFFATNGDMRLLSYSFPWRAKEWQQARAKLSQRASQGWQQRGYQEEIRLGRRLSEGQKLHSINHYLILPNSPLEAGHLNSWGISARAAIPPTPLPGPYATGIDHLWPVDGVGQLDKRRPYAVIIASHRFKDKWDWNTLSSVLTQADGPMIMALDVRKISSKAVELATNGLQASASAITKVSDKETLMQLQAADFVMTQLAQGQGFHHTCVYIMMLDKNLDRLRNERLLALKTKLSPFMEIEVLKGYLEGAARIFTPAFNKVSGSSTPSGHHNILSEGAATMAGGLWGFYSQHDYKGIYMGARRSIAGQFTGLHYLNLWEGQSASHMGIFGQTGSGKTVAVQALLAREAERGTQVIMMEPQGHSRRLAKLIGKENCLYTKVGYEMAFNPLDIVEKDMSEQTDYFLALLELLLNPRGNDPGRPRRYLSNIEIAAVSEALRLTYRGCKIEELMEDQSKTPTLEIFVQRLSQVEGAETLAQELKRLYVTGPWSETFNRTSTVNMRLKKPNGDLIPAIIFDFSEVPEDRRAFFYFAILAGVNREIRKSVPYGHKRPERIFALDEAHYLMSGSTLAAWLAKQFKTARTFRTGFWVIDQDPMTLIGLRGSGGAMMQQEGHDAMSGLYMLNNMPYIMSLHLSLDASESLAEIHPEIRQSHRQYLAQSGPGQAVIKSGTKVHIVDIVLRPTEEATLLGS